MRTSYNETDTKHDETTIPQNNTKQSNSTAKLERRRRIEELSEDKEMRDLYAF